MVRRRDAGPSRPSVQQGIAAAMGTTSFTQIKVSELAKYVGADLSILGSFWDNCPEADVVTLYPIKVVQYDVRHTSSTASALDAPLSASRRRALLLRSSRTATSGWRQTCFLAT